MDCFASALDGRDDVAGFCFVADFTEHPFVWTRSTGMITLGALPGQSRDAQARGATPAAEPADRPPHTAGPFTVAGP